MSFGNTITTILLFGLFVIALISAAVIFSEDNELNDKITNNPDISKAFGNISKDLNESSTKAQSQRESLEQETSIPILSYGFFFLKSILDAGKVFTTMIVSITGAVFSLAQERLSLNPIITGTILAITIISLVLLGYKLYKTGE